MLKNQTFELMLSLDSGSYSFLQQFRAVFQNIHFTDTCATVYDRFDNFPLMSDKIRVRSTDEGLLCSQMMKR